MINVDIAEAHSRFDELIHRSQRGECFIVLEKEKPITTDTTREPTPRSGASRLGIYENEN